MMGLRLPTWKVNPNMPRDHPKIRSAFIKDHEAASRDFGAKPSGAILPYFKDRAKLLAAFQHRNAFAGESQRDGYVPATGLYCIGGDPSNVNDSFGIAFAHMNKEGIIVVDGATRLSPDRPKP